MVEVNAPIVSLPVPTSDLLSEVLRQGAKRMLVARRVSANPIHVIANMVLCNLTLDGCGNVTVVGKALDDIAARVSVGHSDPATPIVARFGVGAAIQVTCESGDAFLNLETPIVPLRRRSFR